MRLEVQDDVPEDVLRLLLDELELSHDDVIRHRAFLDFTALNQRLAQNGVHEKLTAQWIDRCLRELKLRPERTAA